MVLADSEYVQPNLIGVFDLFDQVAQAIRWIFRAAGVIVRRGEAVNSDLHWQPPPFRSARHLCRHRVRVG